MTSKALFLDRDGVININHGYVFRAENIDFIDGIFELCRYALSLDYNIFIITNQSGIARGYYHEQDFKLLVAWLDEQFLQQGIVITDTFFCPHHPSAGTGGYTVDCACRKPKPGMILQAQKKHNIELSHSVFIGDKLSDMQAAENAGVKGKILFDQHNSITDISINVNKITSLLDAKRFL